MTRELPLLKEKESQKEREERIYSKTDKREEEKRGKKKDYEILPSPYLKMKEEKRRDKGGYSGGEPPLTIPNREVKPSSADGTALHGVGE